MCTSSSSNHAYMKQAKFAPWARVCNTCCCKKGLISSGLETSLAYVPKGSKKCTAGANKDKPCTVDKDCPGSTCPKLSCQGWYMNLVSFLNAASAMAQRGLLTMRLQAAYCFD